MKEIKLSQGKVAIVDDEDYDYLLAYTWHYVKYACASIKFERRVYTILMHRMIMNANHGQGTYPLTTSKEKRANVYNKSER